jgi:hypothetical protein
VCYKVRYCTPSDGNRVSPSGERQTKAGQSGSARGPLRRLGAAVRSRGYYRTLRRLHEVLAPETYLEIGIRKGDSLALATTATVAIGIDPKPMLSKPTASNAKIFAFTSDEFFATHDVRAELGGRDLDLVFIDGMHLFEFVLRDFANLERWASPNTVVVLHDCLPVDEVSASRERTTSLWTGDVWKVVPVLRRFRPDLSLSIIDVSPSGLVVVEGLDATSTVLVENADRIVEEFTPLDFGHFKQGRSDTLELVADFDGLLERLAARRRG